MAYLRFDFETATVPTGIDLGREVEAAFTPREWLVIRIAQVDDGRASSASASWLGRLMQFVFGVRDSNPLADPRLEALRQVAASLWKTKAAPDPSLNGRLRDHGFNSCQLTLLSSWVATQR